MLDTDWLSERKRKGRLGDRHMLRNAALVGRGKRRKQAKPRWRRER